MTGDLPVHSRAALSVIRGCLVATIPGDLDDEALTGIRQGVLAFVYSASIKAVVFDMGAVRVLDTCMFGHLTGTARMAALLGASTSFVALQPGAVSALVDMDVDTGGLLTFRTMEAGIDHLAAGSFASDAGEACDEEESSTPCGDLRDEEEHTDEPAF